jgi:Protein of unknown function (DUF2794)
MTRQNSQLYRLADYRKKARSVTYFNRAELNQLLSVYSRHVIRGEWRDYAIDHRDGFAVFSIFRHSQESPAFSVMKYAGGGSRSGEFQVYSGRRRLSASKSLADALQIFRARPSLVGT